MELKIDKYLVMWLVQQLSISQIFSSWELTACDAINKCSSSFLSSLDIFASCYVCCWVFFFCFAIFLIVVKIIAESIMKRRFIFVPTILLSMVGSSAMRARWKVILFWRYFMFSLGELSFFTGFQCSFPCDLFGKHLQ